MVPGSPNTINPTQLTSPEQARGNGQCSALHTQFNTKWAEMADCALSLKQPRRITDHQSFIDAGELNQPLIASRFSTGLKLANHLRGLTHLDLPGGKHVASYVPKP